MSLVIESEVLVNKLYHRDFLKPILDTITEGVVVFNDTSVVIACNLPALKILEVSQKDILGTVLFKKPWKLLKPDGSPFKVENLPSVATIKTGKPIENIVLGLDTSDYLKWLKVKSTPLKIKGLNHVLVSFSDITAQFETNKEMFAVNERLRATVTQLALSENKFHSAFNYSGIGIALVGIDGRWLDVNPVICKMLGYSKEEFLSMTFQDVTHPDDLLEDIVLTKKLLFKKLNSYQMEKRYYHKSGKIVWVLLSVSLVWKNDDTPDFFISQIMDITAAKELLQELEFKNNILQTTTESLEKRMKQVKEFNHIVAHNLRGPAGTMHMLIDLLKRENTEEERDGYLKLLSNSSNEFQKTLENLLQLLQHELTNANNANVAEVEETVERVKAQLMGVILSTQAVIKTKFDVATINIPKAFLESIIYNLVSNAIKYSKRKVIPTIEITTVENGDEIELIVKDNGIGIDLEKYGSDVFKLNKTFHSGYESKGIGLYMTKNQIENVGGSIHVKSQAGEGTTFNVLFKK